jgi:hypothetical protein
MNENGHPPTLRPTPPGNTHAVKSGIYSATGRVLAPRAEEIAKDLMAAPHVVGLDSIAAEEIGALLAHIEAIDRDMDARGRAGRKALLDMRARLSRQLRDWLKEFGATPRSRAEWARTMAEGGLAAEIARRRQRQQEDT